jgi:hypothetical protein
LYILIFTFLDSRWEDKRLWTPWWQAFPEFSLILYHIFLNFLQYFYTNAWIETCKLGLLRSLVHYTITVTFGYSINDRNSLYYMQALELEFKVELKVAFFQKRRLLPRYNLLSSIDYCIGNWSNILSGTIYMLVWR